ncbi:MAG TPA: hypothetical protein VFQ85_07445 [Mycobacteriales bacterium]|jgi:hypothetical protein|nr:hypothetical protein [Mycobacteriales bacterium]
MLTKSFYEAIGHEQYVALYDHVGTPVPPCIRDAKPAPPPTERSR